MTQERRSTEQPSKPTPQGQNLIEKAASAPALALDKTIQASQQVAEVVVKQKPVQKARAFWQRLGPGLTTGAADDDPAGIGTYSQTGAQYGFQLSWLALFTFPFMAIIQEMCARIGLTTGRGLAANLRRYFPKPVLYLCTILLFIANTFNIGADLGAMASATKLVLPGLSFAVLLTFFTIISLTLQIFTTYEKFARYLKWLALILISYILTAFAIPDLNWSTVLRSAITPSLNFSPGAIVMIAAVLGTTISPYLFFWQTSQEVEEEILSGSTSINERRGVSPREIKDMRIDVWSGMFLSNLVMFFIIATSAAALYANGLVKITSAADAAAALQPLAGENAFLLFALGIIGTGMLAVPVLAGSTSYAIAESFRWKQGLYRQLRQAYAFYGVIIIAMAIGFGLNFVGINPINALIYSAVINGLIAPLILALIVWLASNKKIMGDRVNHPLTTALGWLVTGIMGLAAITTIWSIF